MLINTTINIHVDVLKKLSRDALSSGESKTYVVSALLRRLGDDFEKFEKSWTRVRYQKRTPGKNWRCLHLYLKPDEYEYFLDLRKVFKVSVSFLVALAVDLYQDEVMKKVNYGTDNYRYRNYMISRMIIDGVVCWMHYWGVPHSMLAQQH
ncbi:MAG: hypothetical protein JW807_14715 [Spirochaetes bacterium]|nr:hypothetical protein [Spirochaetota bacterium]